MPVWVVCDPRRYHLWHVPPLVLTPTPSGSTMGRGWLNRLNTQVPPSTDSHLPQLRGPEGPLPSALLSSIASPNPQAPTHKHTLL